MTLAQAFNQFRDNLKVREGLREQVNNRQTRLRNELMARDEVTDVFLSGSWSRGTRIEPLNDLDLFMVLKKAPGTSPQTLEWTRDRLAALYKGTTIRIQARSVGIRFQDFSFDVVPATPHANFPEGGYVIPDGKGEWMRSNPKKHREFTGKRDQELGSMGIPLVKMFKCWKRAHDLKIKSFHLEVLVLNLANGKPDSYVEGARRIFCALPNQLGVPCWDPAKISRLDEYLDTSERARLQVAADAAAKMLKEAIKLDGEKKYPEALALCRQVFGTPFPA